MMRRWASDHPHSPTVGEFVTERRTKTRYEVVHVGRFVWLSAPGQLFLCDGDTFWYHYDRRQQVFPFVTLLALALLALAGCFQASAIAVTPSGTIWLAGSASMQGPQVYVCTQHAGALDCSTVPVHLAP